MAATVEEQMVVKAIREECPWESLPKRLQSTLHTKEEWHRRFTCLASTLFHGFLILLLASTQLVVVYY